MTTKPITKSVRNDDGILMPAYPAYDVMPINRWGSMAAVIVWPFGGPCECGYGCGMTGMVPRH